MVQEQCSHGGVEIRGFYTEEVRGGGGGGIPDGRGVGRRGGGRRGGGRGGGGGRIGFDVVTIDGKRAPLARVKR